MSPQNIIAAEIDQQNDEMETVHLTLGRELASPAAGEEIVISGISGKFPDSDGIYQFRDNLFNKVDLVSDDTRRWEKFHPEIPQRTGKIYNVEKFDAGYFGIHYRQAHTMDPMTRLLLERTIECIFDAGLHPSDLEGSSTGVFVGACFSETEKTFFFDDVQQQNFAITGLERSFIANRLSYYLKLNGPSFICDTACSSSLYAFDHAYRAIRLGHCERAIVGGTNLCLHPFVSLQFSRLGVLSKDGKCRVFDNDGGGYARSEAISAILLEKSKDCKRIYATVLHSKTNCDGYKEQGITYPSGEMQQRLLKEFYEEVQIDPTSLSFLEAHGTGTKVGDPEECAAIDEVFCKNRTSPLLVGSVKSNIGHSEPASGVCSIAKVIIGMESGYIPPNINYATPREEVKVLTEGRIKVVTEKTPFQDNRGLIGINSFGFGGGNAHVLLRWNTKQKINGGQPKDDLPRLVCVSARVKPGVTSILDHATDGKLDVEYIRLLQNSFRKPIDSHKYRGFSITSRYGEILRSARYFDGAQQPLCFAFASFDQCWKTLHNDLFKVPIYAATIQRIHDILSTESINLMDVLSGSTDDIYTNLLGSLTVQYGIADILRELEINPDHIFGYSLGELVCAYFDQSITLSEAVLCAHTIAKSVRDIKETSVSYLVNLDAKQAGQIIPEGVEVAAIVSETSAIISGNPEAVNQFISKLEKDKVQCEKISEHFVDFHGKSFAKIKSNLTSQLQKILSKPKQWSSRHLSKSQNRQASAEFFINALTNIISFKDLLGGLKIKSVILEIGSGEFQNVFKTATENYSRTLFVNETGNSNTFVGLLETIGRLYEFGYSPQVHKIFPEVSFPVSRGTKMVSPLIKWNHESDWFVAKYMNEAIKTGERLLNLTLKDENWKFAEGHLIDGRNLFPATGYLYLVWDTLGHITGCLMTDHDIVFENCKFNRATTISNESITEYIVMIQRVTGHFEVIEGGQAVVTGRVYWATDPNVKEDLNLPLPPGADPNEDIPMKSKDIYKELRLRGYNYRGAFRAITEVDSTATRGTIKWEGNWISFMDNLLQMKILQVDTRLLYVPTRIKRLYINSNKHLAMASALGEDPHFPAYVYKDLGIIKCGGIEIRGLNASSIAKRKILGTPVLEKYLFVPNETYLGLKESLRVNMQIALENSWSMKAKGVELIDECTVPESELLGPIVHEVLGDQPLIQPNITILSKNPIEDLPKTVTLSEGNLVNETDCMLVVGTNILSRLQILHQAFGALKEAGYVLSREPLDFDITKLDLSGINILSIHQTDSETLVFFNKKVEQKKSITVRVSNIQDKFDWLPELQKAASSDSGLIVYSQDEPLNGILGLVNCMRREPGGNKVRAVFIVDEAPVFDPQHPFYATQLSKNMAINVFKNGVWGTYRHLLLDENTDIETEHCYANVLVRGDLSSLRWIEGPLNHKYQKAPEKVLTYIYNCALNFRDIMTASGKLSADVITPDRTDQECVQGFEFTGRTPSGERVMGMITHGALGTMIEGDKNLMWKIPDNWTMEEASTVTVVYGTVLYALISKAKLKRGDKLLIHSGTGGIGLAAINVALFHGCTVYTTAGTQEKREWLKKHYPQLNDRNIGNSRDTSFEKMVMRETGGRGVDIVLNSLAEEKLQASVRCLAQGGRFLEIGKFDLANDNELQLLFFEKEASFHGIMVDMFFNETGFFKSFFHDLIDTNLRNGCIKPLPYVVYKMDELEQAFRFMATGKHIGKVIISLRKEEKESIVTPSAKLFKAVPRYFCSEESSYIITGGLGGFGLELADWLILRGARKLVLTSRTGIKTGYQNYRINLWKSYQVNVKISTADITTKEGCEQLIREAQELGPISGIFNLAVVLKDAILENQTDENFQISFGPKAIATRYLDELTRVLCPDLKDFVVFSSVSCGRGNGGQTNYGMSNSVMERICEKRYNEGYPALAIEWGAIGEVGLVAEMQEEHFEMEIGGTLQQKLASCLQVMDVFMRQKVPIVSSIVVAEKRGGAGGADNIIDTVANILGIKDLKTVSMHSTLAELGMDSMTAVEIKQTLEREFEVFLTAQDIRSMTFARLQEIQAEQEAANEAGNKKEKALVGYDMILRFTGSADVVNIPEVEYTTRIDKDADAPKVILIPGIEGIASVLTPLTSNLNSHAVCLQLLAENQPDTIIEMAKNLLPTVRKYLSKSEPFNIVSYSFGGPITLELIAMLEQEGYSGRYINIDGAPEQLIDMLKILEVDSEALFQTSLICHVMSLIASTEIVQKHKENIFKSVNFDERIRKAQEAIENKTEHSPEHVRNMTIVLYKRLKALMSYKASYSGINSEVKLIKPTYTTSTNLPDDYKLSETIGHPIEVVTLHGNHVTILENIETADFINKVVGVETVIKEEKENPTVNGEVDSKNGEIVEKEPIHESLTILPTKVKNI